MQHIKNILSIDILSMITLELVRNGAQKIRTEWDKLRNPHIQPEMAHSQITVYDEILRWEIEHEREDAQKGMTVVKEMMERKAANEMKERDEEISGFGRKRIDEEYYKDMQWRIPNQTNDRLSQLILEHPEMFKCSVTGEKGTYDNGYAAKVR